MKRMLIVLLAIVCFTGIAYADPWLGVDPATVTITRTQIEVTKSGSATIVEGVYAPHPNSNAMRVLDLAPYVDMGAYRFRVRWYGTGNWPSEWSDPFDATKPPKGGILKILE